MDSIFKTPLISAARNLLRRALRVTDGCAMRPPGDGQSHHLHTQPCFVHPYALQDHFTGRAAERSSLTTWLTQSQSPVLALIAIGGMGKTALSWLWVQRDVLGLPVPGVAEDRADVAAACRVPDDLRPDGVLWWSFYETQASFADFLRAALSYAGGGTIDPAKLQSDHDRVGALLGELQRWPILFVLDGFERELRAYASLDAAYQGNESSEDNDDRACTTPAAAEFLRGICSRAMQGRVLLTSRLFPKETEGRDGSPVTSCRREELTALWSADAVAFFGAQGIEGSRAEIEAACEPFGYHPLALRLLSGMILEDPQRPGDIAAAPDYDPTEELIPREHHILQLAYDALTSGLRDLLSGIAAFRSPVGYEAVKVISPVEDDAALGVALRQLAARGLLLFDRQRARYDLHPVIRRYAYDRLTDKAGTHTRLREYFASVPSRAEDAVRSLDDLTPVIELYHHTVRAGRHDDALNLFCDRLAKPLYFRFGAYQTRIELLSALFTDGEDSLPLLKDEGDQAWALNALAASYSLVGPIRRAAKLFEMHNAIRERRDDKKNLAVGLGNLARQQMALGLLAEAEGNLRRSTQLLHDISDEQYEATGHQELGRLLAYKGQFEAAGQESAAALATEERWASPQGQCLSWSYRALSELLADDLASALEAASQARDLADKTARTLFSYERDSIRVEWLLGWAKVALADQEPGRARKLLATADGHLTEALTRCRRINLVESEPDILLARARWHRARGEADAAHDMAAEALDIADRCEYRLVQADCHNFMARLALDADDRDEAASQAQITYERAWCDGPPYCYKPALDEAERMLDELGVPLPKM